MKISRRLAAAYFAFYGLANLTAQCALAAETPASSLSQVLQLSPALQFSQAPQASAIPYKHDHISSENDLPRVALGLTACLLLLAGVVYVIRRRLGLTLETGRVKQLRVVESHRLNPRSSLYVVEFAGKYHMLAQSEQGINCLASTPVAESAVSPSPLPSPSPEQHG